MDSRNLSRDKAKEWISDRRNKAIIIGVIVLATIAMLQVANQRPQRNLASLFPDCQLKTLDLQRMQIALSKAGLREFEVSNQQLLVPQQQTAQYLEAISEHNAVPNEFQAQPTSTVVTNPFLSYWQQVAMQREARNRKLEERLMLLPFVAKAWFEMDESGTRYGNQSTEKSALVTIRPKLEQPLLEEQIYTISQLVCGAINGLGKDQIVIVDLISGFAHQGTLDGADFEKRLQAQWIAFSRKQQLESRLRESLSRYAGLGISVLIEADSDEAENQTASAQTVGEVEPAPEIERALVDVEDDQLKIDPPLFGANGQVKLDDAQPDSDETPINANSASQIPVSIEQPEAEPEAQLSSHSAPSKIEILPTRERVTVIIDVPERLLLARYGNEKHVSRIESSQRERTRLLQNYLEQFKPELEQTIRAVLNVQGLNEVPVVYNLIASDAAEVEAGGWMAATKMLWAENWPSVAVLVTGLVIISLITARGKSSTRNFRERVEFEEESPSTIKMTPRANPMDADECAAAKVQLSQMIEKDPDAAARVIENWIRDAA